MAVLVDLIPTDRETWIFVCEVIAAGCALGTFFRLDVMVRRALHKSVTPTPYTGREKVMAFLVALSVGLCGAGFYFREPGFRPIILSFGPEAPGKYIVGDPNSLTGGKASVLRVDGSMLDTWQRKKYKLIGVCFHHLRSGDVLDEENISRSGTYDIEDRIITITIPWNNTFIAELVRPVSQTSYELLAMPPDVPDNFITIRQAVAMGAVRIARASGTP